MASQEGRFGSGVEEGRGEGLWLDGREEVGWTGREARVTS